MGGTLISWSIDRAEALVDAAQGDLVDIEGAGPALVTALLHDRAVLAPRSACARRCGCARAAASIRQLLVLLAVIQLRDLPAHAVGGFVDAYLAKLRDHGERLAAIRTAKQLEADDEKRFLQVAIAVATPLLPS